MLQNEPENQPSAVPAAQIRVPAEELTQAINALEDQAARRLEGTVPIGQVVQELDLSATPEEIWAQVQRQRWVLICVVLVVFLTARGSTAVMHSSHAGSSVSVPGGGDSTIVSGNNLTRTHNAHSKDVVIKGNGCRITLHGLPKNLTVIGNNNTIKTAH